MNAVITYIFGKNTEILREPLIIDGNTEYICVTDQKNLRSKHYHIIQDAIPQARMIRWIGAPCRIVSERSVHNYLGVEEMDYDSLFNL